MCGSLSDEHVMRGSADWGNPLSEPLQYLMRKAWASNGSAYESSRQSTLRPGHQYVTVDRKRILSRQIKSTL